MTTPAERVRSDVDYSLLGPLLFHSFSIQLIVALLRVTISYRIIELDLPVVWLGLVSGAFALLPAFLAVQVGRFIDRGNDARAAWIGSALISGATIAFWLWPGAPIHIIAYSLVAGFGMMFIMASHQMLCLRAGGERGRDAAFGNFTVAQALGQGLGPMAVAWIAGAARLPPTDVLFKVAAVGALGCLAIGFALRPISKSAAPSSNLPTVPLLDLLRTRGFGTMMGTASDLLPVYLPLLGIERGIGVNHIGFMLTVRSVFSVMARMFYATIVRTVGHHRLLIICMVVGGGGFFLLGMPFPLSGLYVAVAVLGLGLGVAATLTLTGIVDVVPVQARGTAMTLRITGNRIGQVAMPLLGSFVAATAGAAGVMVIVAGNLWVAGLLVNRNRKR